MGVPGRSGWMVLSIAAILTASGCLQDPSGDPLEEYLASSPDEAGEDCPFPSREKIQELETEVPQITDFTVGLDAKVYLIDRTTLTILDKDLEQVDSWSFPEVRTWRKMTVAVDEEVVAVAHFPTSEDYDPDDFDKRGVLAFTLDGEPVASWEVGQVRGMESRSTGQLVVLHDQDREQVASVVDRDLRHLDTFTFPQQGTGVRDFGQCGDEFFWLDSWDHDVSGGASRLLVTDLLGEPLREWPSGAEPTQIAVGHDLVILSYVSLSGGHIQVYDLEGEMLLDRFVKDKSAGDFVVAHGMVYRVADGLLSVKQIESFLQDPPGEAA